MESDSARESPPQFVDLASVRSLINRNDVANRWGIFPCNGLMVRVIYAEEECLEAISHFGNSGGTYEKVSSSRLVVVTTL